METRCIVSGSVAGDAAAAARVNVFAATFESGQPFQGPVTVMLKEYGPGSRSIGVNELRLLRLLEPMPAREDRWRAASAGLCSSPAVPALGWFEAPPSDEGASAGAGGYRGPDVDSLWVVCKWDGLQPAQAFLAAPQRPEPVLGFGLRPQAASQPRARRCRMLKRICQGALGALGALHACNVAHGSLGLGSLMLSSTDEADAGRLSVKLDNLGFGATFIGGRGRDSALASARRADQCALAVALCELIFGSLSRSDPESSGGGGDVAAGVTFQRLLQDVYGADVRAFEAYCDGVAEWADATALLDGCGGGGWDLLGALLTGDADCVDLVESPWLEA